MNRRRLSSRTSSQAPDSERGAALILALAVMVAIGGVLAGLSVFMSTSSKTSKSLQDTRNEFYAADGAIEAAIRTVQTTTNGTTGSGCPAGTQTPFTANGVTIHLACADQSFSVTQAGHLGYTRNVVFTACATATTPCPAGEVIINAKVNFPVDAGGNVIGAFVQSWSVRP